MFSDLRNVHDDYDDNNNNDNTKIKKKLFVYQSGVLWCVCEREIDRQIEVV